MAAQASAMAPRDDVRSTRTSASPSTAPATNVITTSALALSVQSTSDGGPRISSALAIHAMRAENISSTSTNCRHTNNTKHARVVDLSAVTVAPVTAKTALLR